jgi:hypothetical protein
VGANAHGWRSLIRETAQCKGHARRKPAAMEFSGGSG